jgi:hypothetical protein
MSLDLLGVFLQGFFLAWLGGLAAVVVAKALTGGINVEGLLSSPGGAGIDPERLTLLVATLAIAVYYVVTTLGTPLAELRLAGDQYQLPDLPTETVLALGGSQAAYLGGKTLRLMGGARGQRI